VDIINSVILKKNKVDISKTQGGDRLFIFQRENFQTSFPADPDSTPIDSNISFLVVSYLSCYYIQPETDYKTTFLANFALTHEFIEIIKKTWFYSTSFPFISDDFTRIQTSNKCR
jgi:hypothetical protein